MDAFADYTFYTGTYGGSSIPEAAFDALALRASYEVERQTLERASATIKAGTSLQLIEKIKMATCAVAEQLNAFAATALSGSAGVASEKVGDHSVTYLTYTQSKEQENQALSDTVERYLGLTGLMFRGIA